MSRKRLIFIFIHGNFLCLSIFVILVLIGIWLLIQPVTWTSVPLATLVSGRKVVIDPGHGGGDPGAKACGIIEKDLNLDISLRLKKYLSRVGVYCIMIREKDHDYFGTGPNLGTKKRRDLNYRIQIANQSKADLFLSIHANSFPQAIYRGAQTFFNKDNTESKRLAEKIQEQLVNRLGPNNRKAKGGDFMVLNFTKIPGVIIETGFLSNLEEAKLLATESYQEKLAEAIFHGVVSFLSDKNVKIDRN